MGDPACAKFALPILDPHPMGSPSPSVSFFSIPHLELLTSFFLDLPTFKPSNPPTYFVLSPFFSHSSKLFCTLQHLNSFVFKQFQTLLQKHPGWGCPIPFIEDQNETANC